MCSTRNTPTGECESGSAPIRTNGVAGASIRAELERTGPPGPNTKAFGVANLRSRPRRRGDFARLPWVSKTGGWPPGSAAEDALRASTRIMEGIVRASTRTTVSLRSVRTDDSVRTETGSAFLRTNGRSQIGVPA
ncbi:MAG TPA: hypothetical protein VF103_01295, partial [Polyangiaceae bacterium]